MNMRKWKYAGSNEGGWSMESDDGYLLSVYHDGSDEHAVVDWYDPADKVYVTLATVPRSELGSASVESWADIVIDDD